MARMKRRGGAGLIVAIVFAVLGAVSGISIFISFVAFKNVNAAIWGLLSAIFAITVLRLLVAHRRDVLLTVFSQRTLRHTKQFGVFGSFAAIVAAITYFTLVIVLKQGYKMENDGYMPAGIFSLLTLKWTAILFCRSKQYEKLYFPDSETEPIANGDSTANLQNPNI